MKFDIVYLGGSITVGTASTNPSVLGWAALSQSYISATVVNKYFHSVNSGVGGTGSWYALIRLQTDVINYDPEAVLIDWGVNDGDSDLEFAWEEACIRKLISSNVSTKLLLPLFIQVTDVDVNDATNLKTTTHVNLLEIANHYGLQTIDCVTPIQTLVTAGTALNTIMFDSSHPTDYGHQIIADTVNPILLNAVKTYPASNTLPARLSADSEYYENATPQFIYGIDNDGETGTGWATVNTTSRQSSVANDTITFVLSGKMIGMNSSYYIDTPGTISVQVDGGVASTIDLSTQNKAILLKHSLENIEHTVVITVLSGTVRIDKVFSL